MSFDELLDRIAAGPADQEVELLRVYADQLIELGDPCGELIVVATQRLVRDTPELSRREAGLIAEREVELRTVFERPVSPTYRWRRGFLDAIEFSHHGDEPLERAIAPLAARPEARLLRRLAIAAIEFDGKGDLGPVFAELARLAPKFPRLVEIVVTEAANLGNPWVDGPINLHDVSPLYAAYPQLEVLELDGSAVQLHDIHLPSVRRFKATHLRVDLVRHFVAAQIPRLADLELSFRYGNTGNVAATFGPLLHRDFGPQLEALALTLPTIDATRWMVGELPGSPLARHLRRLAFRHGPQDEPTLEALIANVARLRLERLELRANLLSAVMQKRLRAVFGSALVLT